MWSQTTSKNANTWERQGYSAELKEETVRGANEARNKKEKKSKKLAVSDMSETSKDKEVQKTTEEKKARKGFFGRLKDRFSKKTEKNPHKTEL